MIRKNYFTKFILIILAITLLHNCKKKTEKEVIFYVSTTGNNSNNGSKNYPFKNLDFAVKESRKYLGSKTIIIEKGNYYNTNFTLTKKDKKLKILGVDKLNTIISGGLLLSNFKQEGKFIYAEIPNSKSREWDFRIIEVNGNYRERARLPEKGAFTHLNKFDVRWLSSEAGGWERKPTLKEKTTLKYLPQNITDIDINNAELTIYHEWDESLVGLKNHDKENYTLLFENESQHPPGAFAKRNKNAQTYVVWNTKEGMSKPGKWFLDRTNERFYYWPKPNENIEDLKIVVPKHNTIISLKKGAYNITIENLTLTSTTTKLITGGYGAMRFEGAISGKKVNKISLKNLQIKNVGGWGIKLSGKNIQISNTEILNCGAGAIFYRAKNSILKNNKLHDIGLVYNSAVGIFGGGDNNIINGNEIFNMPYCGINGVGNNTTVENNLIHNIKTFMQDGGAIYMFGHKNTTVKNNVVLTKKNAGIKTYAYYLDEGCEKCVVENNFAYNTVVPVQAHMTRNCTYKNNVFYDERDQTIAYANSDNLTFDNNILIAKNIYFKGPTKDSPKNIKEKMGKVMKAYSKSIGITSWKNNIFSSKNSIKISALAQYKKISELTLKPRDGTQFSNLELKGLKSGKLNLNNSSKLLKSLNIKLQDYSKIANQKNLEKIINFYNTQD